MLQPNHREKTVARSNSSEVQESLNIKRILSAPIEQVFAAWTNPEALAIWFRPAGFTVTTTEIDLRAGGKYLIVIQRPDKTEISHYGEYVDILAPEKLIFTWIIDNQDCGGSAGVCAETLVTIKFRRIGKSTEVQLTHERLPSKAAYEGHGYGWNATLDELEQYLRKL